MSRKRTLLNKAERVAAPPKRKEFRCPVCNYGVADVRVENGMLVAECHACCTKVKRTVVESETGDTCK